MKYEANRTGSKKRNRTKRTQNSVSGWNSQKERLAGMAFEQVNAELERDARERYNIGSLHVGQENATWGEVPEMRSMVGSGLHVGMPAYKVANASNKKSSFRVK